MSNWPEAVLFDFDGVIVNSEPVHFAAFVKLFAEEGISLSEKEYYAELIGFDDRGAIRHLLAKHGRAIDAQHVTELKARKLNLMNQLLSNGEVPALPGVDSFVRGLAENYPLAICSGAVKPEIEIMLDGVGLREFFPIIVAADDVSIGKPDPMGYLLATELVGRKIGRKLSPAEVLIIEDAPIVVESVRRAGFAVLAVTTSYPADALADANWVVETLEPVEVTKKVPELKLRSI
ncbi:MAG TPA: HAD family phosphatase [Tepidisphaeraceae bacterium]|nr:HAD family phosphatase [Tepidisphaeraceae bacterium]